MFGKKKLKVLIYSAISAATLTSCQPKFETLEGNAQGTTYHIIYEPKGTLISTAEIDILLDQFDLSLSTYKSESLISNINALDGEINIPKNDLYFERCFIISKEVANQTDGAFDPTLLPLAQLWGFMKGDYRVPSDSEIDSVLQFAGWEKNLFSVDSKGEFVTKKDQRARLDFNAVAQGLAVDIIAEQLEEKGILNFFVELGGELRVRGTNRVKEPWKIGIDEPLESNDGKGKREMAAILELNKGAIATSGNYRKFFEEDGEKFAHTLNAQTGRPVKNEVLSATVFCADAARADAYATALMAMGLSKAKSVAKAWDAKGISFVINYSIDGKKIEQYWSPKMKAIAQ